MKCPKGHNLGFVVDTEVDKNIPGEWYAVRCTQCGTQALLPVNCPSCNCETAYIWRNRRQEALMVCSNCGTNIGYAGIASGALKDMRKLFKPLIYLCLAVSIIGFIAHQLGLSLNNTISLSVLIFMVCWFVILGLFYFRKYTK